nr:hypothetical protein [uncultured Lachnoclostridium sp.]
MTNRNRILKVGDNRYECQACGNRELKSDSKFCSVCGIKFENTDNE